MRPFSCLLFVSLASGCGSEPTEHPPLASDRCGSEICKRPSVGGVTGRVPSDAGADSATDAGMSEVFSTELVIFTSPDLQTSQAFSGATLDVVVEDAAGQRTTSTYSGGTLDVSVLAAPQWLKLEQVSGDADLMGTLLPVQQIAERLTAGVVQRQVMVDITENLITTPLPPDPSRGHAILRFHRDGVPLTGVSVLISQGTVAYDVGPLYSDVLIETGERGAVALLNLPAVPFPGGSTDLEIVFEGESSRLELDVAQDAVSLLFVEL